MAITSAKQTEILKIAAGLFNAAPGGAYLTELANLVQGGMTTSQLADALAAHSLFTGTIMAGKVTTDSQVAVLMKNFGFVADNTTTSAGSQAQAYFTQQINAGVGFGKIVFDAVTYLSGSPATEFTTAANLLTNKALVAATYSESNSSTSLNTLQGVLSSVTGTAVYTQTQVNDILNNIGSGPSAGQTFVLTTTTDTISGTSGNDTIIGDWSGTATVNASDQINGGGGVDVLKVFGTPGSLPAVLSSVETIQLVNPGTLTTAAAQAVISGLPSGVNRLSIDQASTSGGATTLTTTATSGLTLDLATLSGADVGNAVTWAANATDTTHTLELSGYNGAAGAPARAFTITGAVNTTLNINTDTAANAITTLTGPATTTTLNIAAATDLNVSTSLVAGAVTKANISGAGKVTIAGSDFAATVTVDGSTNKGGVLYTAETGGSTLTFKGGSGNDKVTFAAATLTTADVLTGGDGTDTLAINDTALTTSGNLTAVNAQTGFETLGLNTTGASLDMSLLTNGIKNVAIGAGNISATVSNSLATSTYTIDNSASNTGTVSIGNKVGELSTAITLDYGTATTAQTVAAVTLNGASTVGLVSTGTGTGGSNTITTLTNMDNSVINVTGSKDLTITNAIAGTGTGSKVDATSFTGKFTVTGSGQADIIIGGTNNDTINAGAGKDTVTAGTGDDTVTVNTAAQQDSISTGTGADKASFSGTSATMFTTSGTTTDIVKITDFTAGTDKIALIDTAGAFTGTTLTTQTIASAADLAAVWSGITAVGVSTDNGNLNAVLVTVSAGAAAGSYLYVNDTAGAAVLATADMLINLTGISGTFAATDIVYAPGLSPGI